MRLLGLSCSLLPFFSAAQSLTLLLHTNSALVNTSSSLTALLPTFSLSIPAPYLSAEVFGTFSPLLATAAQSYDFSCSFSHLDRLFLWLDDHMLCQHGAFNNSANGAMDVANFTLRSKTALLPLAAHIYPTPGAPPATLELRWRLHAADPAAPFSLLPPAALSPALPAAELSRRALQRGAARGWGSWLHRDILTLVRLPDSAAVTAQLCHMPSGVCLQEAQIDGNGGGWKTPAVRVGSHALDHSYAQFFVAFLLLNVSIEFAVSGANGGLLDLTVTPQQSSIGNLSEYAVAFAGSFAWGRAGVVEAAPTGLRFAGAGLPAVQLACSAPPLSPGLLPPVHAPGLPGGAPCSASRDCASGACSCTSQGCGGVCAAATPLVTFAAGLGGGAVGLTSATAARSIAGAGDDALAPIAARLAAARHANAASNARFGSTLADTTDGVTAALGWRNVFVPSEAGPVMPVTYGFAWVCPAPATYDWAYILFDWVRCKQQLVVCFIARKPNTHFPPLSPSSSIPTRTTFLRLIRRACLAQRPRPTPTSYKL